MNPLRSTCVTLVTAARILFSIKKCSSITHSTTKWCLCSLWVLFGVLLLEECATSKRKEEVKGVDQGLKESIRRTQRSGAVCWPCMDRTWSLTLQLQSWKQELQGFRQVSAAGSELTSGARDSEAVPVRFNAFVIGTNKSKMVIGVIWSSFCMDPEGLGWHCGIILRPLCCLCSLLQHNVRQRDAAKEPALDFFSLAPLPCV